VFGHPLLSLYEQSGAECEFVAEEQALAEKVGALWAHFAREGSMDETWPRFRTPSREVNVKLDLGLVAAIDTETGYRRGQCDMIDELGLDVVQGYAWVGVTSECQHARLLSEAQSLDVLV